MFELNSQLARIESDAFSSSSIESIEIPRSVRFIDGSAFVGLSLSSFALEPGNETFIVVNGFLIDIIRHALIWSFITLSRVEIPNNIEILGSSCLSSCGLFSSITFESNSRLRRIESFAFSSSSIKSIEIPRSVQFIDGSAFAGLSLSSLTLEPGNETFIVENGFLIDILHHALIWSFLTLSTVEIPNNIEILGSKCFSQCKSFSSITFESNSQLIRIESFAFSSSSLQTIVIPSSVEILGSKCFSECKSLSSITFESNSRLTRIESEAFSGSSLQSILIPSSVEVIESKCFSWCKSLSSITFESNTRLARIESEAFSNSSLRSIVIPLTILFVASDAICTDLRISLLDWNSCPEIARWLFLRGSGIAIDFRRIVRVDSGLRQLKDYVLNLSIFEKRSMIRQSDEELNEI
jgi:uncharacterized protein YuzB (UPF0349 family)